jgi:hypothetical protein
VRRLDQQSRDLSEASVEQLRHLARRLREVGRIKLRALLSR